MRTVMTVLAIGLLLPLNDFGQPATSFGADGNASSGETYTPRYDTDVWFGPPAEYEHKEESVLSRYPILMFLFIFGLFLLCLGVYSLIIGWRPWE